MPGLRRLDGDVSRLQIAHLAHHQHIRVLPQEGAQGHGKGQPRFVMHIDLVDARQMNLARVLDRGDVHLRGIQNVQTGVQRLGFARPRRARDQHHAVRLTNGIQQP